METFAERLKQLRKRKALTQTKIAEFLGCTVQHYQRIEYGKINLPTLDLIALANYFDVSIDYLVGRSDNPERQGASTSAEYIPPDPRREAWLKIWDEATEKEKDALMLILVRLNEDSGHSMRPKNVEGTRSA